MNNRVSLPFPEVFIVLIIGLLSFPVFVYIVLSHVLDYRILKVRYYKSRKWDLNISCANTDGGGINADIVKRDVPNFVLIKNIYKLPFADKQFKNTVCSHTLEHAEDPDRFYKELRRVSRKVTLVIPPIWDIAALGDFREHKWQFLVINPKQENKLPKKIRLPWFWYQRRFGQSIVS